MTQDADPHDPAVAVTVVRSGGFAGLTRRWGVQAPPGDAQWWCTLVEDCPWDDAPGAAASPATGADRFTWSVQANLRGTARRAELTESEASGPWRTLIDAVRTASDSASPTAH